MRIHLLHLHGLIHPGALGACLVLAGVITPAPAQNPTLKTRTQEQRERQYLETHRITLNVQVEDRAGKPVRDLSSTDFTLFDNNQPRKLAGFHRIDGETMGDATEVVLVLDAVNSTAPDLQRERDAIFNYLAHGHGPLPYPTAFVLWFNGHLKASAATTDRNALGRAFVSMTKNVHSNACLPAEASVELAATTEKTGARETAEHISSMSQCQQVHSRDSVAALDGIAQQQKTLGGRTILIWAGSGWPVLSEVEFGRLAPKAKVSYFEEFVDVLRDLRESQVTIDAIAPIDETHEKEVTPINLKALLAETDSFRNVGPRSLALSVLAAQTGGRVLTASRDMAADLASCIRDADGYYSVLIEAMPATSPHEFHKLEIRINRPSVDVRTLNAYYAEP